MPPTEYSKYQKDYWWATVRREIISSLIEMYVTDRQGGNVLDIGCGSGGNFRYMQALGRPFGLDFEHREAKTAKEFYGHAVTVGNAEKLPFKDNVFSVVSIQDVLEHLYRPQDCLEEILRVSVPGGVVVITVPSYQFLFNPVADEDHRKRYLAREIEKMVQEAGLEILKLTYFNTLLFPLMLAQRLLQKAMLRIGTGKDVFPKYPTRFGKIFGGIFKLEKSPLKHIDFPFGGSVLCICKKPGGS